MTKTFYVLRAGGDRAYINFQTPGKYSNTLATAQRFTSIPKVLTAIQKEQHASQNPALLSDFFQIVRVEETVTEGTKRRVAVPLGDKRQTGVALKSTMLDTYWSGLDVSVAVMTESLATARIFSSEAAIISAINSTKNRITGNGHLVGIVEETVAGTSTFTETVLA